MAPIFARQPTVDDMPPAPPAAPIFPAQPQMPDDVQAYPNEGGPGAMVMNAIHSLFSLPQRAIENSQTALDTGNYNPAPAVEAAMLPMGTGAIAGVPVKAGEAVLGAGPIRAYHGSPHNFDAFDMSKIGTGEGAQAYGHGLYFAEEPQVAQQYRDQLRWKGADFNDPQTIAQNALDRHGDRAAAADNLQSAVDSTKRFHGNKMPQSQADANASVEQAIAALRGNEPITGAPPTSGRMYEVNINADPAHFLDWDKPLKDQPDAVHKFIEDNPRLGGNDVVRGQLSSPTGEAIYRRYINQIDNSRDALKSKFGDEALFAKGTELARREMADRGIPGIKYLDQGSRSAGEGSRNYVVFDHKLIDIARKYGLAGAAIPPLAAPIFAGEKKS